MVLMNKGLEIRIYPRDELIGPIHQNIGNARFVWNNVLSRYNKMYEESKETENEIHPSLSLFNNILNDLKQEFPFLKKSESTSLQQVLRDLLKAFKRFFNGTSNFPKFKSRKRSKKTFRV
jgi:putative transposase